MENLSGLVGLLGSRVRNVLASRPSAYHGARRAVELARFTARRPHEADFAAFALFPERRGLFLDVGANSGASALSFRIFNRASPILSIEAHPMHRRDLVQVGRLVRNFKFFLVAAGDHGGTIDLWVPYFGATPLSGEASVVKRNAENTYWAQSHVDDPRAVETSVRRISVPMIALDDLELAPDFVKIDVEGAELSVLRGLEETLRRTRPVCLLEVGHDWSAIPYFAEREYAAHRFDSDLGALHPYTGQPTQNLFFLPRELDPGSYAV